MLIYKCLIKHFVLSFWQTFCMIFHFYVALLQDIAKHLLNYCCCYIYILYLRRVCSADAYNFLKIYFAMKFEVATKFKCSNFDRT